MVIVFTLSGERIASNEAEKRQKSQNPAENDDLGEASSTPNWVLASSGHEHAHSEPVSQCQWIGYSSQHYNRLHHD